MLVQEKLYTVDEFWEVFGEVKHLELASLPNVGVFMARCGEDCAEGDAFLAVRSQVRGSSGKPMATDLITGMIPPAQTQEVLQGIENRKALYGL